MDLDFTALSDDQLVGLIKMACTEAVRRNPAVEAAARAAVLDEAEKSRIVRDASEKAAEDLRRTAADKLARETADAVKRQAAADERQSAADKQAKLWRNQKSLALLCEAVFGPHTELNVWEKGDKRVYIDRKNGKGPDCIRVEYYLTGNRSNPPKSLHVGGELATRTEEEKALVRKIVEKACVEWNSLRQDNDVAIAADIDVALPEEFAQYRAARLAREQAAAEKKEAQRQENLFIYGPAIMVKCGIERKLGSAPYRKTVPIMVTRSVLDPTRIVIHEINIQSGKIYEGPHVGSSSREPFAKKDEETRALFTDEEQALLENPACLPTLDYAAIAAIVL